jgi:hypothetical protein
MSKRAARLALVFALLGLGASATAADVHYPLRVRPPLHELCDVSETVSCSQVYLSRFSSVTIRVSEVLGRFLPALAVICSQGARSL